MKSYLNALSGLLALLCSVGCGGSDSKNDEPKVDCSVERQTGCKEGLVCETLSPAVNGSTSGCFEPYYVAGRVFDLLNSAAVNGARVVLRDANDSVVSTVAVSDAKGNYQVRAPAPRSDAGGTPVLTQYTLRADAAGYLSFPKAPRVALPVEISSAASGTRIVKNSATNLGLIPLENAQALGSISGVVRSDHPGGTLIVAGGVTGIADRDGSYRVFNVPSGANEVRGYAAGVNLKSVTATVNAAQDTPGVDLGVSGAAAGSVTGSLQFADAAGVTSTSVILVVEDTFVEDMARGEAPPGLRAGDVSGSFAIQNVPDGKYVVLAAFENDRLVRDPDTSIGGTEIQHVTVTGGPVTVPGFKVTRALAVISPGADGTETVHAPVQFVWEDDSSETAYHVEVFDPFGKRVWETTGNFDPGGSKPATVAYGGDPLTPGLIYQFRATSLKSGVPISRTEDLKGVFAVE